MEDYLLPMFKNCLISLEELPQRTISICIGLISSANDLGKILIN